MPLGKRRLLVLTPRFPYPVIGGDKLRIYNLCKVLSSHFSLTLLSLCESKDEMDMDFPNDGVFDRVERVFLPRYQSYLNVLRVIASSVPLQVAYYRSSLFSRRVDELLTQHDGVIVHLIRCAEYVRGKEIPKLLEMTDAIAMNYSRIKSRKGFGGIKRKILAFEAKRLLEYERNIVNYFDCSVVVSEVDKRFLFGDENNNVLVCSNGVDFEKLNYRKPDLSHKQIIFIGDLRSIQNLDACDFFIKDILPHLRKIGDFRLRVVGSISGAHARYFSQFEGVQVTGRVDSVAEAVRDGSVGVCPMRIGAGIQNKILEYMALGLPVVTTSISFDGIGAQAGRDLFVADTARDFSQRIIEICGNSDLAERLSRNGRRFVETTRNWESVTLPVVESLNAMLANSKE